MTRRPAAAAIALAPTVALALGAALLPAVGAAPLAVGAAPLAVGAAQERGGRAWVLESFHADIEVLASGELEVVETIRPRFSGRYNGIFRTIPLEYRTNNLRRPFRLSVRSVTDGAGAPLRHETSRDGNELEVRIWVPDAEDATRTARLSYQVSHALLFHEADGGEDGLTDPFDELYWNVTGTQWPVPIEAASAAVRLPAGATGVRAHAFTGAYGDRGRDAEVEVAGSLVEVRALRELAFREGLTIGVGWDAGLVSRPTAVQLTSRYLFANWPLFLPFLAFAFMYRRWNERGRDPEISSIEPRYEPPGDLTPAEVGVVIDNRADLRDLTATLVDLAVRGHVSIEEVEEKRLLGLAKGSDYIFRRAREFRREGGGDGDELAPHERALLDAVFNGGRERRLSDLKDSFYKELPKLKSQLLAALIQHGVYTESPARVTGKYVGLGVLVGIVIFFGGGMARSVLPLAPAAVIVAAVVSALVIIGFGIVMPARTTRGTELLRQVRGFEEFLSRVESDRYRRMVTGPDMFEKYLPYAMALGVASAWANAFRDLVSEPPSWYVGYGMPLFNAHLFATSLETMSTEAHGIMQSAPRSAGSSSFSGGGFSGGGFSGGGFGGGGGGAF